MQVGEKNDLYDTIGRYLDSSGYGEYAYFLNWGYQSTGDNDYSVIALPDHYPNRNCVKLILELTADTVIEGKDILDIGCGRGGAVYTLNTFFNPSSVKGLDLSHGNISFCNRYLKSGKTSFEKGDALFLPYEDNSFDVVLNIESSRHYNDIEKFYREVKRVLKDGGVFLYSDIFDRSKVGSHIDYLEGLGFEKEIERDIRKNVILSRNEMADMQFSTMKDFINLSDEEVNEAKSVLKDFPFAKEDNFFSSFLCQKGTLIYEKLSSGEFSYSLFRFRN